jgi:hypothetical protein
MHVQAGLAVVADGNVAARFVSAAKALKAAKASSKTSLDCVAVLLWRVAVATHPRRLAAVARVRSWIGNGAGRFRD